MHDGEYKIIAVTNGHAGLRTCGKLNCFCLVIRARGLAESTLPDVTESASCQHRFDAVVILV